MKSLSETVKDGDQRKRQLEEQIDQLNEECAKLCAQGRVISFLCPNNVTSLHYWHFFLNIVSDFVCCFIFLYI